MDHTELRLLFKSLDNSKAQLTRLENEFIHSLKNQYRFTGLVTPWQMENLITIKEKVQAAETASVPEPDYVSSLYSQLQEFSYLKY